MTGIVVGSTVVGVAFVVLFVGAWWVRARTDIDPEVIRKALHVGMGTVALPAPWWFSDPRPVYYLAGASIAALLMIRWVPALRQTVGQALFARGRTGWGELHFVFGVVATFVLSGGNPLRYCLPVAILTYADTAACLVGRRVAGRGAGPPGGTKTFAGSMAFAVTASVAAGVAFAAADVGPYWRFVTLTAAIALLTTAAEALGRRGLDNLLVPVAATVALTLLGVG